MIDAETVSRRTLQAPSESSETEQPELEAQRYLCNSERHLTTLHYIYSHALRVSYGNRLFFGSQAGLAQFFACSVSTIQRAFRGLEKSGFFEVVKKGRKQKPNVYRVLSHDEWKKKHPGRCVAMVEYPWTEENDLMGKKLWSITAGDVHWQTYQVANLRKVQLSDEQVVDRFARYWTERGQHLNPGCVPIDFFKTLKSEQLLPNCAAQ